MNEVPEGLVLLDVGPGMDDDFDRSLLERFGHPVSVCHGPDRDAVCPLLGGEGCADYEAAHGIVFSLDLDRPQHRDILRAYRALGRVELPIRVVCSADQARRYADILADVQVWTHEPTVAELDGFAAEVEAVDRFA